MTEETTKRRNLISLAKTRWVERHNAFENYHTLYHYMIATFDSIANPNNYANFFEHLKNKFGEEWEWGAKTMSTARNLHSACRKSEHLVAFSIVLHAFAPLRPVVSKLQKRNQDIYQAYKTIDTVIAEFEEMRTNIDQEFQEWYGTAKSLVERADTDVRKPRTGNFFSRYRANQTGDNANEEDYYRSSIAVPFMDYLVSDFKTRVEDRAHVETLCLLPSVFSELDQEDLKKSLATLKSQFSAVMPNNGIHLANEFKRWQRMWLSKPQTINTDSDSLVNALNHANSEDYPTLRSILEVGFLSPIGSTEAERAASGVRSIKTPYRSSMVDIRESNLLIAYLQQFCKIDVSKVAEMFVRTNKRKMFSHDVFY